MKQILIVTFALMLLSVTAFGFGYELYDFGDESTLFDHNNNWAPIDYPYGIDSLPSPGTLGEGGEKFDLEGMNVAMDDKFVYVSLTNSFGYIAPSDYYQLDYTLGDLFIGVNNEDKYGFAIDLFDGGNSGLYQVNNWGLVSDKLGSYNYNDAYPEITEQAGAWQMTDGTRLGDVNSVMRNLGNIEVGYLEPGTGETYLWEFQFEKSLFGNVSSIDALSFHVTLECGNDLIETTHNAVPEPATMLMFGLGLAGMGLIRKKRKQS